MAQLRIIQGGVTAQSARALIIAKAAEPPRLRLERIQGAVETPHTVSRRPAVDNALRRDLERRGIRLYLVEALNLLPGTAYRLKALIPGAPTAHADFDTLPQRLPDAGLTIAVGSCYYAGYHRDAQLSAALALRQWGQVPAFHIWCGDNLYMDVPVDSPDNRPVEDTISRYLGYLFDSEYASARALAPTFTTYDDHEFWNNFPEFQLWLSRTWSDAWQGYRDATLASLELFQASLNPAAQAGRGYFQVDLPPLRFFFLDTRSFRVRGSDATLITPQARDALSAWCNSPSGPGVLVLGQPMWIGAGGWTDRNLPYYPRDYAYIWSCLRRAPYDVLVISGDVHHSRVLKIGFSDTANSNVYEFISSPACHIPNILGFEQDRGDLRTVPGAGENTGQQLAAKYYFGTDAQNTFGLLRFVPLGNEVQVGASFVDYMPTARFAAAKPIDKLPRATSQTFSVCHDLNLFTLRKRQS